MQKSTGPIQKDQDKSSDGHAGAKDVASPTDQQRGVNPMDQAEKCKIGDKLNSDAARYKKGPGPF